MQSKIAMISSAVRFMFKVYLLRTYII